MAPMTKGRAAVDPGGELGAILARRRDCITRRPSFEAEVNPRGGGESEAPKGNGRAGGTKLMSKSEHGGLVPAQRPPPLRRVLRSKSDPVDEPVALLGANNAAPAAQTPATTTLATPALKGVAAFKRQLETGLMSGNHVQVTGPKKSWTASNDNNQQPNASATDNVNQPTLTESEPKHMSKIQELKLKLKNNSSHSVEAKDAPVVQKRSIPFAKTPSPPKAETKVDETQPKTVNENVGKVKKWTNPQSTLEKDVFEVQDALPKPTNEKIGKVEKWTKLQPTPENDAVKVQEALPKSTNQSIGKVKKWTKPQQTAQNDDDVVKVPGAQPSSTSENNKPVKKWTKPQPPTTKTASNGVGPSRITPDVSALVSVPVPTMTAKKKWGSTVTSSATLPKSASLPKNTVSISEPHKSAEVASKQAVPEVASAVPAEDESEKKRSGNTASRDETKENLEPAHHDEEKQPSQETEPLDWDAMKKEVARMNNLHFAKDDEVEEFVEEEVLDESEYEEIVEEVTEYEEIVEEETLNEEEIIDEETLREDEEIIEEETLREEGDESASLQSSMKNKTDGEIEAEPASLETSISEPKTKGDGGNSIRLLNPKTDGTGKSLDDEMKDMPLEPRPLTSKKWNRFQANDPLGSGTNHSLEDDPLSSITSHRPKESRPVLTRGNSTTCVVEPEAVAAPASPVKLAPPPMSTKMRQKVKALESSFVLSVEDIVKLLDDLRDLVKGNSTKQMEFGSDRGITAFVKVLKKYEENPTVLEICVLIIADLAEVEINRDALALNGVIEVVLIGMLRFEHNLVMQERGCYALSRLAGTRKYQEWIVASNGIQVIMTTQAAFKSNVKIQAACLSAIHSLAKNNKENAFSVAAKGGIRALMEIVKLPEHKKELEFHMEACAVMATLARTNDSNRGSIAAAGGIETTLAAMKRWPENPGLQAVGFDTLHTLIKGHAQNSKSIMAGNGVELLIQSMKAHESDEKVLESALLFAKYMTGSADIATKFGAFGGVKLVLSAMRQHDVNNSIQEEGCSIICNMSMQHENKGVICKSGGIGMIVMAMKQLSDNFFVQKNGCNALLSLATNDETKKMIASGGGISVMLLAMRTHRDVPALHGLAVGTLRKLATVSRNRNIMKMNNGIETVERSMKKNPNLSYLQQNGEALLLLLDPSRKKEDN